MIWSVSSAARGKTGDPNGGDDAVTVELRPDRIILAVADGAGSARLSALGADAACRAFCEVCEPLDLHQPELGSAILNPVRAAVLAIAEREQVHPMELASTLLGVILEPEEALFFQLGDGAIVIRTDEDSEYETALLPPETEYVNTTHFVTSPDAEHHAYVRTWTGRLLEVALLSDGLQGMVQHPTTRAPHPNFFEAVFRTLRNPGLDAASVEWLTNMLASDMVTSRTDDDTSIVLAKRL